MGNEIYILHFSDLHMKKNIEPPRRRVIEALTFYLKNLRENGQEFHLIICTGDIAYQGEEADYQAAWESFFKPVLVATGLTPDKVFLVPGNHDSNRAFTKRVQNPLAEIKNNEDLERWVRETATRDLLMSPFKGFRKFCLDHFNGQAKKGDPTFAWVWTPFEKEKNIVFIGINSAFLSNYNKNAEGKICDRGVLAISLVQLEEALQEISDSCLLFVCFHHSLDWLIQFDKRNVETFLKKQKNCWLLSGHDHIPNSVKVTDLKGELRIMPAGSVFDTKDATNHRFSVIKLDYGQKQFESSYFHYNASWQIWQIDDNTTGGPPLKIDIKIIFEDMALNDLRRLGIEQNTIKAGIIDVFKGHKNYCYHDIAKYPIRTKDDLFVLITKVEKNVWVERILRTSISLDIDNILATYRKATWHSYRTDEHIIFRVKRVVQGFIQDHHQIILLICQYLKNNYQVEVDPWKRTSAKEYIKRSSQPIQFPEDEEFAESIRLVLQEPPESAALANGVFKYLAAATRCLRAVSGAKRDVDEKILDQKSAQVHIVTNLEQSLQYLHKIINEFLVTE